MSIGPESSEVTVRRTLLDVVRLSTTYLGSHGSVTPRLDAELLAAQALGMRRLDIYLQFDRPLDAADTSAIRSLVLRRGRGEPVAYIIGRREFYGRPFAVTPAVLIPRPDTETLIEAVLNWARHRDAALRILDIGTGSGCIALTLLAEIPDAVAVATDISEAALQVARDNAGALGVLARVELRLGSWAEPLADSDEFDIVVSNPPYVLAGEVETLMPDVRDHEPRHSLVDTGDGLQSYREVIRIAASHLGARGMVALEVDPRRAAQVVELAATTWPDTSVRLCQDLSGQDRVVAIGEK